MEPTRILIRLPDQTIRKRLSAALPAIAEFTPVSDVLIRATVQAATQVVRGELLPDAMMSAGTRGLVDDAMRALASQRWNIPSS